MSKSQQLILVTGASGFIGSHIVVQLLDAGYRVRGTARGGKLDLLRNYFKSNPNFEVAQVDDVAAGDFTAALKGVGAVIHVASPLAGRQSPEDGLKSAIEGTLNLLRQAVKAGVNKVVLTSSWATTLDPSLAASFQGVTFTEKDWGNTSREDLLVPDRQPLYVYCGTKTLAEIAAWKFAEENPQLDLATINPPFVYGPPIVELASGTGIGSLGTNALLYRLIFGEAGRPLPPQVPPLYCYVGDVARAHVLALAVPPNKTGDRQAKRFLVAGPGYIAWGEATKILEEKRPALKDRLAVVPEGGQVLPGPISTVDTTRAREVLGIKEYKGNQETLLETIDALVELEKTWK